MNIGIIGLGKMGEAIAKSLISLKGYKVYFNESDDARHEEVASKYKRLKYLDIDKLIELSSIVIIAVKPQNLKALLNDISTLKIEGKLFISIVAGISIGFIKREGSLDRVVRAMPNMGALVKESFMAISCSEEVNNKDIKITKDIFSRLGKVKEIREELMDPVTAISGSGPAYFAYFIKAIRDAADEAGLKEISSDATLSTLRATLSILEELNITAEELIERVKSPGGTTEACLSCWQESELSNIIKEGIKKAIERSKELGE